MIQVPALFSFRVRFPMNRKLGRVGMDERQLIGSRIACARKAVRLSQVELGKQIGVSGQTISNWETARYLPNASDIAALSKTLHCSADFLLGLSDTFAFPPSGRAPCRP